MDDECAATQLVPPTQSAACDIDDDDAGAFDDECAATQLVPPSQGLDDEDDAGFGESLPEDSALEFNAAMSQDEDAAEPAAARGP